MDTGRRGKREETLRRYSATWLAAISAAQLLQVPGQEPGVRRGSAAAGGMAFGLG